MEDRVRAAPRDLLLNRLDERARERRRAHEHLPAGPHADRAVHEQPRVFVDPRVPHRRQVLPRRCGVAQLSDHGQWGLDSEILEELRDSSAGSVSMRTEPRAASDSDALAIVSTSGASTTFTKSNSPSVAHWWQHLDAELLDVPVDLEETLRVGLQGLDALLRQRREEDVVGMRRRAYPGGLVVVQQRAAEEEQRREHDVGEREGGPRARVALRVEQRCSVISATPTTSTSAASEPRAWT